MIAARNSCMHSWRQGVPDTLAAMTTAVSGSDYALSCYLDTVREQRHCTPSTSNRCKQTDAPIGPIRRSSLTRQVASLTRPKAILDESDSQ